MPQSSNDVFFFSRKRVTSNTDKRASTTITVNTDLNFVNRRYTAGLSHRTVISIDLTLYQERAHVGSEVEGVMCLRGSFLKQALYSSGRLLFCCHLIKSNHLYLCCI